LRLKFRLFACEPPLFTVSLFSNFLLFISDAFSWRQKRAYGASL
jgi:hypothetical protein